MTDVAYLYNNCGSVHEVESIRGNLVLDLHAAASYELSGQRGMLNPHARFLRWRMTRNFRNVLFGHHQPESPPGRQPGYFGSCPLCAAGSCHAGFLHGAGRLLGTGESVRLLGQQGPYRRVGRLVKS